MDTPAKTFLQKGMIVESTNICVNRNRNKNNLGKPSIRKSHKSADLFRMGGGGAQPHSIAFGGVFPNITEAILVDEISTKVGIYPPKVIT